MELFVVHVEFVMVLMASNILQQAICTSDCSFYTFHDNTKNWRAGRAVCQANAGDLLSMETEEEYQFINKTIQGLSKGKHHDEWYIGLRKRSGVWKWVSNHSLNINKWQPRRPDGDGDCVIIAKEWPPGFYGLFNDLRCDIHKMFICEYKNAKPNVTQGVLKYCPSGTASARPVITTTSTTRSKTTVSNELTSSYTDAPSTEPTSDNTSIQISPDPKALRTSAPGNASKRFPTMLVAIVLGALLGVGICIFFVVFCWLKTKSGRSKSKNKPWQSYAVSTPMAENRAYLTNRRNNMSGQTATEDIQLTEPHSVVYAEIPDDLQSPDSPTPSSTHSEVEYANSASPTTPSGYANLMQDPVYENQMSYQPLNKYPDEVDEDEIAI